MDSACSEYDELVVIATSMIVNYLYNGFFALLIIVMSSLLVNYVLLDFITEIHCNHDFIISLRSKL